MASEAIPGIAIPLLHDGCVDTHVDSEWVDEVLSISSRDPYWLTRIDIDSLRDLVEEWFKPDQIREILGTSESTSEIIAEQWLAKGGKRWRPFLSAAVFRALAGPMPRLA